MILEALNYSASLVATPAEFRGHIASSIRLWARASRCRQQWAEHEANTKAHIIGSFAPLRQKRTAVVLGSGLLRDVPIRELVAAFDTVVLVDLVHLAHVRGWLSVHGRKKTRLISRDLSGLQDALAGREPEPLAFLRQVPYLDFVASANLLSQITVGARRLLESEGRDAQAIVPKLIQAHLAGLAALPCKTCLVTDISYEVKDRQGKVLEQDDLLAGVAPPQSVSRWQWPVMPFGEESRNFEAVHQVIAA